MIATGAALRLGFTQAVSRWETGLLAALASIAEVFAGVTATMGVLAWLEGGSKSLMVALGASLVGLLAARIMLALVQGGAVRQSSAWLKGQGTGTALEEVLAAAPQSLAWFAWMLPIEVLATAWKWAGIAAVTYAYGHALVVKSAGFSASVALAAFVTASIPLAVAWAGLRRVTLVRTVTSREGVLVAASRAVGSLVARPGAFLLILGVGLAGGFGAELVLSMFGSVLSPDAVTSPEPVIASQLAVGVLVAFSAALFELVILFGFTALESQPAAPSLPAAPVAAVAPVAPA